MHLEKNHAILSYLLGRMAESERDAFEACLLEDEQLFAEVRETEAQLLDGAGRLGLRHDLLFLGAGVGIGFALGLLFAFLA